MRIASVLGILFFVSVGRAQIDNILGLNLESVFENVQTIENAFGASLTKKFVAAFNEVAEGTFTPKRALEFLEELNSEEKDGAVNGLITLVKELERMVSAPGVKDQMRMGFDLAPFILRQLINYPSPTQPLKKPARTSQQSQAEDQLEDKTDAKVDDVVVKLKQNETKTEDNEIGDDLDTDRIRGMLGNLMGSGKVPDEFLEVMEQLLDIADEYEDAESLDERLAIDDKSTSKLAQIKDKLGNVDELLRVVGGDKTKGDSTNEEGGTNEDKYTKGENAQDSEKDEL